MRVWVDLTNSPHVLVFRPLIALLRERGHEVEVTAREYAQTMQLLELHRFRQAPAQPLEGTYQIGGQWLRGLRCRALRAAWIRDGLWLQGSHSSDSARERP